MIGAVTPVSGAAAAVEDAYRREWARVLGATVRVAGDLDLAEECVQEAFVAALETWSTNGVPAKPGAWLTTAAKRKAIDQLRRASSLRGKLSLLIEPDSATANEDEPEESVIADDRLRLVFTCCHPSLAPETQGALTLRLVCGLPTGDIARLFLVSESTMAARITRGKRKIEVARIPFVMPRPADLDERLDAVLTVILLFFTAGHTAASGDALVDREVVVRSLQLGRLLHELVPGDREVAGLLALMLLADARREARTDDAGELVLLADQDRSRWDVGQVGEGRSLADQALGGSGRPGRFALQAGIAAVHAGAPSASETDWPAIVGLYDRLGAVWPSPVVELNRAVAVSMALGPEAGLAALADIESTPELRGYHYLPAARADLLRRLGRRDEAADQYRQALISVGNDVERRFLKSRLAEVQT